MTNILTEIRLLELLFLVVVITSVVYYFIGGTKDNLKGRK